jgi:hypothetical protein
MVPCGDKEALAQAAPARQCASMSHDPDQHNDDGGGSRRGALIGLLICAVLVVAAYYLVNSLHNESQLEDCLASHRTNCAPLDIPTHK